MAVAGGVAGGLLGALLAPGLRRRLPRPAVARTVLVGSLVVLAARAHQRPARHRPRRPRGHLRDRRRAERPADGELTVPLDPADFADDPAWVQITAWQGDGLVVNALERTGEGDYRTTEPVPLHGNWKTLLRVHDGRMLTAFPIYLPADEAIPAEAIPAEDGMTRSAIPEIDILQRELKESGGGLWAVANLVVLACTLALIAAISWGVGRYSRRAGAREPYPDTPADEGTTASGWPAAG